MISTLNVPIEHKTPTHSKQKLFTLWSEVIVSSFQTKYLTLRYIIMFLLVYIRNHVNGFNVHFSGLDADPGRFGGQTQIKIKLIIK